MKNQINKQPETKLQDLASTARARMLSSLVLIALFGLVFSGDIAQRVLAVTDTTNATQNVDAGATTIDQVPNNLAFSNNQPGGQSTVNITNADSGGAGRRIKITSTASASFSLTAYFNTDWYSAAAPSTQMPINTVNRMRWFPAVNAVLQDVSIGQDSLIGNVALGSNVNFNVTGSGGARTLLTGSSNSKGKYAVSNLSFQYDIPVSAAAATDYTTVIVTTLT